MDTSCPANPEHCESCPEKYGEKALTKNGSGPYVTPLSPISSYASSSSFGDIQAGLNLQCREDGYSVLDADVTQRNMVNDSSDSRANVAGFGPHISTEKKLSSSSIDNNEEKIKLSNEILDDAGAKTVVFNSHIAEEQDFNDILPLLPDFEADPDIWIPPEPEDMEDDTPSIADNDEDDDYNCLEWNQSNLLSSLDEHQRISQGFKEKRQKAMLEAMNGQFKFLVSRFLASEGIDFSSLEAGQSWLDIVASLSWKAALLVKLDAAEGRAMDPGSYVKVKCIASGSRHESELIKGLVFKKNAAHKHMPTKFKNPRILLLQGVLVHSAVGLSSFESMEQEKNHLKVITDMIEACHPNVVLVERNISRDIQDSLLEKGITVVSDMKIHRLEKVSLCTGSPIISCSNFPTNLILPQCDLFRIERFMEEYNSTGGGGKRSSKTLMFLVGFQKPLGCTILLKGAQSDELKKIKRVVQYAVFAAYHLILETSFLVDLRVSFSNKNDSREGIAPLRTMPLLYMDNLECCLSTLASEHTQDVPVCNGSLGRFDHRLMSLNSDYECMFSDKSSSGDISLLSPLSATCETFEGNNSPPLISEFVSLGLDINNKTYDGKSIDLASLEASDHENAANSIISEEKIDDGIFNYQKTEPVRDLTEAVDADGCEIVNIKHKDVFESVLDPQSIIVLLSKQCPKKGTLCDQSHLSRIKYYGYFDISLGRFLRDILLNQNSCSSCSEPPEAHVYCYTHQNGNLSVHVRQLPQGSQLPGEVEGKIWMWTRCLRCKNGNKMSTRRVVLSKSACNLSFGKLLELSFSGHSSGNRLSECGHSLHRDFLRFFGLGSKVAMFVYSSVKIYAACKPPAVLQFHNPKEQEWLKREMETVLFQGCAFFSEVSDSLQNLKPIYYGPLGKQCIELSGSLKPFSEIEEMLIQEKFEFETSLLKALDHNKHMEVSLHEILGLKWLGQELLLELYIWDRRLDCLLQHTEFKLGNDECVADEIPKVHSHVNEQLSPSGSHCIQDMQIDLDTESTEASACTSNNFYKLLDVGFVDAEHSTRQYFDQSGIEEHAVSLLEQDPCIPHDPILSPEDDQNRQEICVSPSGDILIDHSIQIAEVPHVGKATDLELKNAETIAESETPPPTSLSNEFPNISDDVYAKSEGPEELIWTSFSDLREICKKDLYGGSLRKFEFINTYVPSHISPIHQTSISEVDLLHFAVGPGGNVLSASENEISSIIACALAISENFQGLLDRAESEAGETDRSFSFTCDSYGASACMSSTGASESERINLLYSASSLSLDESSTSSIDGSSSVDLQLQSVNLHPEVIVGRGKVSGKSIFSVICIYAKHFYDIRKKCCPSELAYISSLSRCKKWDAQGGKSKVFFAKSLDERFIIKQIKKTELDSFLKFGPDYFKHVFHSLDTGSQTCLAKILGVYQVRKSKSGKETKIDVMVMENLLYGHKISRTYDLKGAVFDRYISDAKYGEKVLLDQNFVEDMHKSPIYVGGDTKLLLQRAVWNDSSFLTSINVMDYSLLVGVDDDQKELVFGIIDYLRQYTWDKQLETWAKASIVPRNELPTVISPREYKKRFRKFMTRYFLSVPHCWKHEHRSPSCIICSDGKRNSAKVHNADLSEKS
ncbi:unnamed protein product [Musa acuminata subsp. malaccensis]|uniref:1-phosphatidylinositol-3-phosphate 5-kinase n=1 Tax=Musa acuminata subsp. malaccensis TaxID=214687 RepID=A0A804HSF0_MUSAM|nr:PREDICTED: 1-phosphatidylinositol-3-phosphate 5-kinase FAB1A-like isoform X1 [Musa acuminata subsp. malaccensis]XP_018682662.1 PREDICTED: 1-phosphatidylinositol-3-phosphate 5-kinase FAB1A-like isoform X1 [Musa acuminata subsp. malaccensis]XP_018682665.1 PREDICTED: 1-phosphatidylinositol-3-phosphate 5-kinase FAB1A-like isoform X1 [Musa acuminata subsp. malaccensis]CAG1859106.1 unnamed protein product [Musa acuminata subsp. malaccensis]